MATCANSIDLAFTDSGSLDVLEKYNSLMQSTLGVDSLYIRAKETLFAQFEQLQLTEEQKAGLLIDFMSKFSIGMSQASMQSALQWAKEERDGIFDLAIKRTTAENNRAQFNKIEQEICNLEKDNELKCVTIEATLAASLRDNGRVAVYDVNNECKPVLLENEGLKYHQTKQVEADAYRIMADTYRKSGVVEIGSTRVSNIDWIDDGNGSDPDMNGQPRYLDIAVMQGINGTTHRDQGEVAGYTAQQTANAERQRIAYEDSKANHAANSSSSMIGQMLSAEVAPLECDVSRWRQAVDRLLKKDPSTTSPGEPVYSPPACGSTTYPPATN